MLIEKSVVYFNTSYVSSSKYICDMCKKPLNKQQRILIGSSQKGKDVLKKRWDLCENCMKIIEKNVNLWYDKVINKK